MCDKDSKETKKPLRFGQLSSGERLELKDAHAKGLNKTLVFVYGSLKSGEWNNYILQGSRLLGTYLTKDNFLLTDVGFPYLIPEDRLTGDRKGAGRQVAGEVYEVTEEAVLARLDALEGEGYHYARTNIHVDGVEEPVQTYIPCGDEQEHTVCPLISTDGKEFYQWEP